MIDRDGPALSAAPKDRQKSRGRLLEGQIDRDLLRYGDVCAACMMGAVGFSPTGRSSGVLKTLAVAPANPLVWPGPRSLVGAATTPVQVISQPNASQKGKSRAQSPVDVD
jgi:hypothetical protein